MSWSYLFTCSKIRDCCCGISHPHTPSFCLSPLGQHPHQYQKPRHKLSSCHFVSFRTIHRSSFVSVPSSAHTSPTSSFPLPLSFIWLDNFQELCNPSFAISFSNLIKVGLCLAFRLACFTKLPRSAFWYWSSLPAGSLTPSAASLPPRSPAAPQPSPCPCRPSRPVLSATAAGRARWQQQGAAVTHSLPGCKATDHPVCAGPGSGSLRRRG